jgi:hypothetical protein
MTGTATFYSRAALPMRLASFRLCSGPYALALAFAGLAACSGSDSPTSDVVLTYDDGTTPIRLTTDSAIFSIAQDSSFIARAYIPATATRPALRLTLSVDSLGGLALPPAAYNLTSGMPLAFGVALSSATTIAAPTAGTVRILKSTADQLSGSLDIDFDYIQFPTTKPPAFHLSGSFTLSPAAATPLP